MNRVLSPSRIRRMGDPSPVIRQVIEGYPMTRATQSRDAFSGQCSTLLRSISNPKNGPKAADGSATGYNHTDSTSSDSTRGFNMHRRQIAANRASQRDPQAYVMKTIPRSQARLIAPGCASTSAQPPPRPWRRLNQSRWHLPPASGATRHALDPEGPSS